MLHTVLPSLQDTPRGIWKAYLEKSRASHHDKYEPWNIDSIDIKGEDSGLIEGFGLRLEGTPLQPPQCPKDQSRIFQEGLKYRFPGGHSDTQRYHLCLWIPGVSFPCDVFVESDTVRNAILIRVTLLNNLTKEYSLPCVEPLREYFSPAKFSAP